MANISDDKIQEFLSMFNGDILAANTALNQYSRRQDAGRTLTYGPPRPASEEIISIQNISKQYRLGNQTVNALRNITLSIGKGEFVAITGASGSGKSTLLQMIGCLDKPTLGNVVIEGKEITKLSDNALSELRQTSIGFIFQSFYLQPFLHLDDNLAVPAMFTNKKKKEINK